MSEFGNVIINEQGFKNVVENGEITGFQVRVHLAYYRGVALSLLMGYEITVDRQLYTNDQITFSTDDEHYYTFDEMAHLTETRWEYEDLAFLHIQKPGGLSRGIHTVTVLHILNVPYLPFNTRFSQTVRMTIV